MRPRSASFYSRKTLWLGAIFLLILCAALTVWRSSNWLIYNDDFEFIAWAVVLDGESRECERTDAAARLYAENKIDTVVLSGVRIFKTRYSSEFMLPRLIAQGISPEHIFELRNDSYSTIEEAALVIQQLRLLNVDTVLIITSNYHSARARMIYNKIGRGNPIIRVHAAEYNAVDVDTWWANRTSLKIYLLEMTKYLQSYLEVTGKYWNSKPEIKAEFILLEPRNPLMYRIGDKFNFEIKPGSVENEKSDPPAGAVDSVKESAIVQDTTIRDTPADTGKEN